MKTIIISMLCIFLYSCEHETKPKGNGDVDFIRAFRQVKRYSKFYADSIRKEANRLDSIELDSLKRIGKEKDWHTGKN